jgi:hypothetical protein
LPKENNSDHSGTLLYLFLVQGFTNAGTLAARANEFLYSVNMASAHLLQLTTFKMYISSREPNRKRLKNSEIQRSFHNSGCPVCNFLYVTILVPRTWRWIQGFREFRGNCFEPISVTANTGVTSCTKGDNLHRNPGCSRRNRAAKIRTIPVLRKSPVIR